MRLLIVGSDKVYAVENYYSLYLQESGVIVDRFSAQTLFYDFYYEGSILRKLIFKAGLSSIIRKINYLFRKKIEQFRPEVIWIFKGMEIKPESILWAKKMGIKMVNYNPDNPFIFTGSGSGNKKVTDSIGLYDLHFTYNLSIKKALEDKYKAKTFLLPFGYDVTEELYDRCAAQPEIIKACFLGNPDKQRASLLQDIASLGISIDVYGNDWEKFVESKNIRIFKPVYGDEVYMVLRKYRVQINLMRIHNEDSHNMRSFEIPGIGGIQLAPSTTEHAFFFENGKDIFLYKNIGECVESIRYLLSLSKTEADGFRQLAKNAVIQKKHSYRDRAAQALQGLNTLFL